MPMANATLPTTSLTLLNQLRQDPSDQAGWDEFVARYGRHIFVGEVAGRPYFVIEFVAGGSLAQHLQGRPEPVRPAAKLVETLARAVHAVHSNGVIHRDLKPANILLEG
jgi:serine/threonine protein kinase